MRASFLGLPSCLLVLLLLATFSPLALCQDPGLVLRAVDAIERVVAVNDTKGLFQALQTHEDVVLLLQGGLECPPCHRTRNFG
jgi:hypothetical protein